MDIATWLAAGALVGASALGATLVKDHGVPERAVPAYLSAARNAPCPLDYRILVAIGAVEYGHGTHGDGHLDGDGVATVQESSYAGAKGTMQFMDGTWEAYATDGDGDGVANKWDHDDATASAAAYLCASNVDENRYDAVYAYNHSDEYVQDVLARADALPPDDGSAAPFQAAAAAQPMALAAAPTTTTEPKGRLCGIGEVLDAGNKCTSMARDWFDEKWDMVGRALNHDDTRNLYEAWDDLNGKDPPPPPPPPSPTPAPAAPGAPAPTPAAVNGLVCPVTTGLEIGDGWGASRGGGTRTHQGVDLFGVPGSPIVAPFDGVISSVENDEGSGGNGGISVGVLAEGGQWDGHRAWMAHNQENLVSPGQQVKAGETIALVGDTGNARGGPSHAHTQWYQPGDGLAPPEELTAACAGAA